MPEFPTGIISLVFTDIQGSSDLWEQHLSAFQPALEAHNRLLRAAAARWNGIEVKTEGDAFFLVFSRASDALRFAVEAQQALDACRWQEILPGLTALSVRIGVHTGEPILSAHPDGSADYFGPAVNRAARVSAAGHGGQILASDTTRTLALADLPSEVGWLDLGEHRLKGVGEEHLWQVLCPGLPQQFPPLKTLNPQRHNLPRWPTPFIGREKESEALGAMLRQSGTRLLTLTGFGGFGKTRLALQLAELCVDEFAAGAWWVELEEARTVDDMMQRIASALGLHLQPQLSVREQVLNFHRERELLLVLDNLEQIPDVAKPIDELLRVAPRVKCLVTTRRMLDLRVEHVVEIRPLPPDDAETLFVERARRRVADFELNANNQGDVAELCHRLEYVPLAIELAASRIAAMTAREMLSRLDEQFRLLQTRASDLPPRQRALRGAIDWSHDLLTEDDQALFAQLAVFAGGFTTAAVEAVCEAFDVFEGLMELRRHSLLWSETNAATQQTRLAMLGSVHAYAREKLAAQNNAPSIYQRHAEYFLRFAQARVARLYTHDEPEALQALYTELNNLRAAVAWAQSAGEHLFCARLALALHHPLYRRGFWSEALEYLDLGLSAVPADDEAQGDGEPGVVRAALLFHHASLDFDRGDARLARANVNTALALYQNLNDRTGQANALNLLGLLATEAGTLDEAQALFEASLSLRSNAENHGRAVGLHNLALVAVLRAHKAEAYRLYLESLTQRRASGYERGEAETLGDLGGIAFQNEDYATARRFYLESLALRRKLDDRLGIALMLYNLAEIAEIDGDTQRFITLLVHSERIFRDLQSAFRGAAQSTLENSEARLGVGPFASLRSNAESAKWENWVDLPLDAEASNAR